MKINYIISGVLVSLVIGVSAAKADVEQIKLFKKAFPDAAAPKCTTCHLDKIPKKDKGKHDLNEYGQKVIKENAKPTSETYTKVGKPATDASEVKTTK